MPIENPLVVIVICEPCKQKISLFVTPPDINIGDLITQTGWRKSKWGHW